MSETVRTSPETGPDYAEILRLYRKYRLHDGEPLWQVFVRIGSAEAADEIKELREANRTFADHAVLGTPGPAQTRAEPVAWGRIINGRAVTVSRERTPANDEPLYAAPHPHEPAGVGEALRLLNKIVDLAYDENVGEPLDDAVKYANEAIASLPRDAGQWQAIESAPKDGHDVLVVYYGVVRVGFWDNARGGQWSVWPGRQKIEPTHWRPLPPPPTAGEDGE